MPRNPLVDKILVAGLALLLAGGAYYHFYYPPNVMKRQVRETLEDFAQTLATKDRAKIGQKLAVLLAEDSKINLEVNFFAIVQTQANRPMKQEFDKEKFITFIDNILYTLDEYTMSPRLNDFTLADDKQTAQAAFNAPSVAEGMSYFLGTGIRTRFTTNINCNGQVTFKENQSVINSLACDLVLYSAPTQEDMNKLRDPALYREFMTR